MAIFYHARPLQRSCLIPYGLFISTNDVQPEAHRQTETAFKLFNDVIDMLQVQGLQVCFRRGSIFRTEPCEITDWYTLVHWWAPWINQEATLSYSWTFLSFHRLYYPGPSMHQKHSVQNLSFTSLQALSLSLFCALQASYWNRPLWHEFHSEVETLVRSIADYGEYLKKQSNEDSTCMRDDSRTDFQRSLCQVCACL